MNVPPATSDAPVIPQPRRDWPSRAIPTARTEQPITHAIVRQAETASCAWRTAFAAASPNAITGRWAGQPPLEREVESSIRSGRSLVRAAGRNIRHREAQVRQDHVT